MKTKTLLENSIETKKIHRILELNQSQWLKPYVEFNTRKGTEAEKNNEKAVYGRTMENLRSRISVKLVNNEKYYLKCTSKPSYMSHKVFDNN